MPTATITADELRQLNPMTMPVGELAELFAAGCTGETVADAEVRDRLLAAAIQRLEVGSTVVGLRDTVADLEATVGYLADLEALDDDDHRAARQTLNADIDAFNDEYDALLRRRSDLDRRRDDLDMIEQRAGNARHFAALNLRRCRLLRVLLGERAEAAGVPNATPTERDLSA